MATRRGMDYRLGPLVWSAGLILMGGVLLLLNFNLLTRFEPVAQYLLAALFSLAAAGFFLSAYTSPREDWAQLIPGWTLVALAAMTLVSTLDAVDQRLSAALLFLGLAAAFGHIYLLNRLENWWAIIPGGFMLVLAAVIALSVRILRAETLAAILFAGMGLVFFGVVLAPTRRRQWWSLVPATVLMLFGLFVMTIGSEGSAGWLRWWPLLLIAAGVVLALFGTRRAPAERMTVNAAPRAPRAVSHGKPNNAPPTRAALGEYTRPAPGATIELLPDPDE